VLGYAGSYLFDWNCAASACPTGWSLPSEEQFQALQSALTAGNGWADWNSGDALGGQTDQNSQSSGQGTAGYWWTSQPNGYVKISSGQTSFEIDRESSAYMYSVRCVKNQ
jgi:uncharacterized protein (TIGR02145 family)